jgi:hypothetical protein
MRLTVLRKAQELKIVIAGWQLYRKNGHGPFDSN